MSKHELSKMAAIFRADIEGSARFGSAEVKRTRDAAMYAAGVVLGVADPSGRKVDRVAFYVAAGLQVAS
jgi:hypothetical protein